MCAIRRSGPQEGSVGLVVEPKRHAGDDIDAFEWYCFECHALVHRAEVKIEHIVKDLPPIYENFFNNEAARKCPNCGAIHPGQNAAGRLGEALSRCASRWPRHARHFGLPPTIAIRGLSAA